MKNDEPVGSKNQAEGTKNLLEDIIREGARKLLQAAIEHEVSAYIDTFKDLRDEKGRRMVVRHGSLPERFLLTGIGPLKVKQPGYGIKGKTTALPARSFPAICAASSLDNLIPVLYLRGISTETQALEAIRETMRKDSASTVVRLKRQWEQEYKEWARRDLQRKRYLCLGRRHLLQCTPRGYGEQKTVLSHPHRCP